MRITGPLSEPIAKKLFKPNKKQDSFTSHSLNYGEIVDPENGSLVDEVLLVVMRSPKTYTREDVVEIQCHGGYFILQKVLELVLKEGARFAQPGEFTKRAFLNGRIDLAQAEAVIDLIKAKTETSLEIANQQLRGRLQREMAAVKKELIENLALIEAHIDFPEEEIDLNSLESLRQGLTDMILRIGDWASSYDEGKIFREGITCAIVGKTNVGKSSLLNVLAKEERAIVTPIPGTTRDLIEEVLNISGIPVRLVDTAGLRNASDLIEKEGVRRTKEKVADSDLVLLMLDGSRSLDSDDIEILEETKEKKKILVLNKNDLPIRICIEEMVNRFRDEPIISISALKNEGIDSLKKSIYNSLIHREIRSSPDFLIVANLRHKTALAGARDNLVNAKKGLEEGSSPEFIAFEIRSALDALGEIVGETTSEDVLNLIFEQFCIGK